MSNPTFKNLLGCSYPEPITLYARGRKFTAQLCGSDSVAVLNENGTLSATFYSSTTPLRAGFTPEPPKPPFVPGSYYTHTGVRDAYWKFTNGQMHHKINDPQTPEQEFWGNWTSIARAIVPIDHRLPGDIRFEDILGRHIVHTRSVEVYLVIRDDVDKYARLVREDHSLTQTEFDMPAYISNYRYELLPAKAYTSTNQHPIATTVQ